MNRAGAPPAPPGHSLNKLAATSKPSEEVAKAMHALQTYNAQDATQQGAEQSAPQPPAENPQSDETGSEDDSSQEKRLSLFEDGLSDLGYALRSAERRKRIESALRPLTFEDMDDSFEIRQLVPAGFFRFLFRTPSHGEIELAQKIIVTENVGGVYSLGKLNAMVAALGTISINNKTFPDHRDTNGNYTINSIMARYDAFKRLSDKVIEDCRIQFAWFDERVALFISRGEVGNG